jgi:A/G-specific adenine glycosylase
MDREFASHDTRFGAPFRRALRAWYRRHVRPLPWRATADPYRIWISEIMLQQTTVAAVVPYFERFLARFPTIRELADADEHEVLRLWEGLGYYSRARNIHRTARLVASRRRGRFPEDVDSLRELPGIGRYTAGAIASFAFDRPAPIVEANTRRLYCRLLGFRGDPRSAEGQRLLWNFAEYVVPDRSPGEFNQALMELGATVCTPEEPACVRCPVRRWCAACAAGSQRVIPRAAARPAVTEVAEAAIAIQRDGKYLLLKREPGERWAGLWDFLRLRLDAPGASSAIRRGEKNQRAGARKVTNHSRIAAQTSSRALTRAIVGATGICVDGCDLLAQLNHTVTRFRITLSCYVARWRSGEIDPSARESRWVALDEFGEYPLSTTGRKLARMLEGNVVAVEK